MRLNENLKLVVALKMHLWVVQKKGFTGLKSRLSAAEETVKKQKSAARFVE